jgi:hypothetical protein
MKFSRRCLHLSERVGILGVHSVWLDVLRVLNEAADLRTAAASWGKLSAG